MNNFDNNWISYVEDLKDPRHENTVLTEIMNAEKIVFVAKGRVGLATHMFMQRLSQLGYKVSYSEDLLVPRLTKRDLVIFVTASGSTESSLTYTKIARRLGVKTMAITFNASGPICENCDIVVAYPQPKNQKHLMKSYYEIGFIYILERIISLLPAEEFVHTNFE